MRTYQIFIEDRNYYSWIIHDYDLNLKIDYENIDDFKGFNPIEHKLFTKDIFKICENNKIERIYSTIQNANDIAGVLILENNKTFGRTENNKRLLYKCIPDDKHLPSFLIPYEVKQSFSKVQKNKYVIFKFDNWKDKHPMGLLTECLGDVDNLEVFYEYQLYCKSLHISLSQFNNATKEKFKSKMHNEYINQIFQNKQFSIEDRRNTHYVFTIDPIGSTDFDDGFSIEKMNDNHYKVSIYIANVYFWIETFGLWKSFSKRISTIYLPDNRRPMLPTILSDTLCSLQENEDRFAFVMDVIIDNSGQIINDKISFHNVLININKNYNYENPIMIEKDTNYKELFNISCLMDKTIIDSHDVVSHWMIIMNKLCGEYMCNNKIGIFRSSKYLDKNKNEIDNTVNIKDDTRRVIRLWNNASGQYVLYNDCQSHEHEIMNLSSYIHITSPIRRIVDLLNQIIINEHLGLIKYISKDSNEFLQDWMNKIEYINISMRSIRKIQTDCALVHRCFTNPDIMNQEHRGIIFDKISKHDGVFSYMVYLEDIKLLSRITCRLDILEYSYMNFKIYLFEGEDKIKKKIRLHILNNV